MPRFRDFGVFVFDLGCFVFEFWVLRFRDLGASFSSLGCFVFDLGCFVVEFRVLRFRDLGASFSSFGCFVLRSSFSSASFSKLPHLKGLSLVCINKCLLKSDDCLKHLSQ